MPTYEYECQSCNHRFEVFQSISASPIRHCPKCGNAVRRLIGTGAGIIFSAKGGSASGGKGSGFYVTDYRKGPNRNENPKGEGKASKSCASSTPTPSSCSTCKK